PRRLAVGMESTRLAMLLAVMHRHAGVACMNQDVFVNAVGGVRIAEPAADLAILVAIVSSVRNKALTDKLIVFGEVGLAGEIRPVHGGQERLREAAKLGFTTAIIPKANEPRSNAGGSAGLDGMSIRAVSRVSDVIGALWDS
ncbi:MAG: S16 family serine protease, partial [Betaproteobacteria bacterium]